MKYKILLSPHQLFLDENIIEGKNIKKAYFEKYGKQLKLGNAKNGDVVIWGGKRRVCYIEI